MAQLTGAHHELPLVAFSLLLAFSAYTEPWKIGMGPDACGDEVSLAAKEARAQGLGEEPIKRRLDHTKCRAAFGRYELEFHLACVVHE
ncbi:hypothetical protein [Paenirhodobacter sp.]|uniref:hypothetical protein n=1 Tax=Paenirhodobacter sp. TaxID=1965326 RepID=UPI003B3FB874